MVAGVELSEDALAVLNVLLEKLRKMRCHPLRQWTTVAFVQCFMTNDDGGELRLAQEVNQRGDVNATCGQGSSQIFNSALSSLLPSQRRNVPILLSPWGFLNAINGT